MSLLVIMAMSGSMALAKYAYAAAPTNKPDLVASKEMVGKWVRSASRPSGSLNDICATDESDWFLPRGRYEGLFEKGSWSIKNGVLTISVTRSNYATGGEGPLKHLSKPEVQHLVVNYVQQGLAKFRTDKGDGWLVRCSGP